MKMDRPYIRDYIDEKEILWHYHLDEKKRGLLHMYYTSGKRYVSCCNKWIYINQYGAIIYDTEF